MAPILAFGLILSAVVSAVAGADAHLNRRHHGMDERIRRNQADPRKVAERWAEEGGIAKRTKPSSTPCPNTQWGQCGGTGFGGSTCCPNGYTCTYSNPWYSQCIPGTQTTSTTPQGPTTTSTTPHGPTTSPCTTHPTTTQHTTTSQRPTTSTQTVPPAQSTCPAPPTSVTCNKNSGGSDGCTPYQVTRGGVQLPNGTKFPANGHINYQAIPCSQYTPGQTYKKGSNGWTPTTFNTHFDPNNNQPGGAYIGKSFYDFKDAANKFGNSFCVTWVQVSMYNQHWGEGGQPPICSEQCCK